MMQFATVRDDALSPANHFSAPIVIRVPIGGYLRGGARITVSPARASRALPGLRIVYPSTAADAPDFRTAIRCDDPVMFLEHKHLYRQTATRRSPGPDYTIPFRPAFGKAMMRCRHPRLSSGARRRAAGGKAGIRPRCSICGSPHDWESIAAHVRRTSRVVVARGLGRPAVSAPKSPHGSPASSSATRRAGQARSRASSPVAYPGSRRGDPPADVRKSLAALHETAEY
jgi:hypothetical protein